MSLMNGEDNVPSLPWHLLQEKNCIWDASIQAHDTNTCLCSQSYDFSSSQVQMWELDHKEAEHQTIDAFELWCWWILLRVPWIARRSNQSVLKEMNPEYSLEGLILQLQHYGHLMQRTDSLGNTLIKRLRGKGEWSDKEWDGWMVSLNQWIWVWVNSGR